MSIVTYKPFWNTLSELNQSIKYMSNNNILKYKKALDKEKTVYNILLKEYLEEAA